MADGPRAPVLREALRRPGRTTSCSSSARQPHRPRLVGAPRSARASRRSSTTSTTRSTCPTSSPSNRYLSYLKFPWKTRALCRMAAAVMAGNAHLAEYASRYNDRVSVVPVDRVAARVPAAAGAVRRRVARHRLDGKPQLGRSTCARRGSLAGAAAPAAVPTRSSSASSSFDIPGVEVECRPWSRGLRGPRPLGHGRGHHAAAGRALGARQVRHEGDPVHGDRHSGRGQPRGREPRDRPGRGHGLPCRHRRGMGGDARPLARRTPVPAGAPGGRRARA